MEMGLDEEPVETTLYSLSEAPPKPRERREGDRQMTLFRVGSITIGERRELCLIKNISAGGMLIRAYCEIAEGASLSIELKSGHPVSGKAGWVKDKNVGVTFDKPIDVVEILSTSMDGPRPRMPRIEVDCKATVRDGANVWQMRVCDISQGGLKVESGVVLERGTDLSVTLPGLAAHPASVRWAEDGYIGITFNRLIPLGELVAWLQGIRDGLRAAG
jgi:hypothetical protein